MKIETYKEKIEDAKDEFRILDAEEACRFVAKLFEIEGERLQENESYATESIQETLRLESKIYNLMDSIESEIEDWV